MSQQDGSDDAAERRRRISLILQASGVFDIGLGLAVAILGPGFFGGDPVIDTTLAIAGGVLALIGLGQLWFGRSRYGRPRPDERSGSVVRRSR